MDHLITFKEKCLHYQVYIRLTCSYNQSTKYSYIFVKKLYTNFECVNLGSIGEDFHFANWLNATTKSLPSIVRSLLIS
jgi:hypothetical protein